MARATARSCQSCGESSMSGLLGLGGRRAAVNTAVVLPVFAPAPAPGRPLKSDHVAVLVGLGPLGARLVLCRRDLGVLPQPAPGLELAAAVAPVRVLVGQVVQSVCGVHESS